jgi:hypothetical protein
VGTWGSGAFDSDDALDLLDTLVEQNAASRRETLERIFRTARERPQDLNWTLGPAEVVAAAAIVAAGLPAGGAFVREISGHDYDVAALVIPGEDPELPTPPSPRCSSLLGAMGPGIKAGSMPRQRCRLVRRLTG